MSDVDWPAELPRSGGERESANRFSVTLGQATGDLEDELRLLDPDSWRVSFGNNHQKSNGMPLHNANPDDPNFVLYWAVDDAQHAVACDSYSRLCANVREVGLWLRETRKRSNREVMTGQSEYAAARLPAGGGEGNSSQGYEPVTSKEEAAEVLKTRVDAPNNILEAAVRYRKADTHPDNDGDREEFKRVQDAAEVLLDGA